MIFSKQFQQGDVIATLVNNTTQAVQTVQIYHYKGIYFADWLSANSFSPFTGRENLVNWTNGIAGQTFSFVNGFSLADVAKLATVSDVQNAFGQSGSSVWDNTKDNSYKSLTGYIEPVTITEIDDPLLLPVITYTKYLQNRLKDNNISFKGFELPE